MRTDKEMLDLIIGMAKRDDRIRAVQLMGSRTNPHAVRDRFQDFDICFYVNEIESFTESNGWLNYLGAIIMMRTHSVSAKGGASYFYEMLFEDGNKIDLTLKPAALFQTGDGDVMLLMSKEKLASAAKPEVQANYNIKPPAREEYDEACSSFWWAVQDVAKGIARDEIQYAKYFLDSVMRGRLNRMLVWRIGCENDFGVSIGKNERFLKQYMEKDDYEALLKTYSGGEYPQMWDAMFVMCALFREAASDVAENCGFIYPQRDDENMTAYLLETEKELPVHPQETVQPVKIKVAKLQREYMPYGSVLVVDDMETNLYVTKGILSLYGLSVDTATSGAQAIEMIEENRNYDIVFMDHLMPDMDGITAANAILERGYTGPMIALTANSASGQESIFISTGFDAFLSKPIDTMQLNTLLNRYIRDKQPPEVLAEARAEMVRRADEKRRQREQTVTEGLTAVFIHDAEKVIDYLKDFNGADIHNYVISVHAMKSTLGVMGEDELSEWAARLESAGQSDNAALLIEETPGFVKELADVVKRYKKK